jgi:predicted AlkP superfamily pyrophosphatase or phosphodiesterase
MHIVRPLRALFACLVISTVAAIAQQPSPILLISIDGMRPDYITQADAHGLKVPHLRRFLTEGSYADGVTGVVPTLTYPSHTTLVTGVTPAVHGITSNTTFDPLFENQVGWFWYGSQLHAETLWLAAHKKGIVTANLNWPVTVDTPGIDFNMPEYWRASTPDDLLLLDALARPLGLQQQLESKLGPWVDGNTLTIASDATRTKFAIAMLRDHHPGFFTVHLSSLDEEEHLTSPFSPDSNRTLEALDAMIGELQAAALAVNPAAIVAVVSDHGFSRTDFRTNLYGPLLRAGLITRSEKPGLLSPAGFVSWKATLWPAGGCAAVMLHDPNDTASLDAIMKILRDLAADPANGIDRILTGDELHALGGFPDAKALVVLHPPFQLGYTFTGPTVTPAPSTGMHGYLPSNPEMRSSFFIMGKGIAHAHDLGQINMLQIAPTLANILGVHLHDTTATSIDLH